MRKVTWRLGSLVLATVLLLSTFPITVRAADEEWIEISDSIGLKNIGSNLSGNYRLTTDIDLNGAEWIPIGPFAGKLDGNSKVIRNFSINDTSASNKGLFSSIAAPGQINNLGIENASITGENNTGILAGTNSGTISRSYTKGSVNGYEYVGGLVGQNLGTIENSFTQASVSGKDYLGGLAGSNSGTGMVSDSYAASSLLASVFNNYLDFNGTPVGNYSAPNSGGYIDIPHKDVYVGDNFTLEAWFQWDDVGTADCNFIMGKGYEQFEIHTGGGSGVNGLRFIPVWNENSDSHIDIKNVIQPGWFHVAAVYEYNSTEKRAAARVYVNGEAQDLWRGKDNLGKEATLSRPFNTLGYEKVKGAYVKKQSPINIGRRTDKWYYFDGRICDVRFWNIARTGEDIKKDKDRVLVGNEPGLVGYWKLNEASGDAVDSSITHNNGTLAGNVVRKSETAATHKGGLIGDNTGTVSDSYYDSGVSGQSDAIGTPKSTADMKLQSTFNNWDFISIWGVNSKINGGYPYLLPEIGSATVAVTAPAAGAVPQTAAQVETATGNADYTVSDVVWNEELTLQGKFKAGQVYTATVTLTSKNGKKFPTEAFTPAVAGSSSAGTTTTEGTGVGNTATFEVTFPATAAKTVTGMQIKNQPADLIYTDGESLNLAGLEVTLTYNDSSAADVAPADFAVNGITASPANGSVLTVSNHNGQPVTLACGSYTAGTGKLTVTPPVPPGAPTIQSAVTGNGQVTISWSEVPASVSYNIYSTTASGAYIIPSTTVGGAVYSCDVTGLTNGTAYYFVVTAVGSGGESAYSNEVSATPMTVPGAPANVIATAGDGQAAVSFSPPTDNGGNAITVYTVTSSPGNITITGTGTTMTVTGLSNGTTYTFTITAANAAGSGPASPASNAVTPYKPSSGDSDESDTPSTPTTPAQPINTGVDILVNGQKETAATATTRQEGDRTVTTITVDDKKIEEKLQAEGNKATVTIPVNNYADVVVGQLNGQTVKNMEAKEAVLEIKTENVTYTLPASQINIDNISTQIGKQVELKDIKVDVAISVPPQETVKVVEDMANRNNYQLVVKPVEFDITCSSGNKTVEVSRFNGYVERMVAIPEGIDPGKITTGIVLNSDGTFSHVPTAITIINGKYYAKINSLTNSTYSVIWSPKTFKDVGKHWAKDAVNDLSSRLVVSGVGNDMFEPDGDISRAEFAAIAVRALGLMRPGTGKDSFSDVTKNDWYYDAVSIAYDNGIISGYGNGKFGPMDKITREQAMTIIARAMKITGLKSDIKDSEISLLLANYSDGAAASDYAKTSIAACLKTGVITGRNGSTIAPGDCITRAEAAVIVRRLLQNSNLI